MDDRPSTRQPQVNIGSWCPDQVLSPNFSQAWMHIGTGEHNVSCYDANANTGIYSPLIREQLEPLQASESLLTSDYSAVTAGYGSTECYKEPTASSFSIPNLYLPEGITACEYQDSASSALISSLDYFYNVREYGIFMREENTTETVSLPSHSPNPTNVQNGRKRKLTEETIEATSLPTQEESSPTKKLKYVDIGHTEFEICTFFPQKASNLPCSEPKEI
ncbi:hypothetical protein XENTR_v10008201 [Xenopus tropicalis]|uniref:Uncharacterized protein LOC108646270 n=1 Tax=Xenopus tropicalis TaxID=8364 RepID=A0A8J0T1P7_XENTR|nr:uncharacterized protein LOC108646270 [Xenopus tropicalis]KAE8614534.1 hypothetical protein XENTR_v10008201 [Xenopus tropicalis]|eukprot:XP_017948234.1 PREDICTED: uncharacterized protein LOC108646270 [Xenopus tropicalis]